MRERRAESLIPRTLRDAELEASRGRCPGAVGSPETSSASAPISLAGALPSWSQVDHFNRSAINTAIVAAITSNLRLAEMPGNVRLRKGGAGLLQPQHRERLAAPHRLEVVPTRGLGSAVTASSAMMARASTSTRLS